MRYLAISDLPSGSLMPFLVVPERYVRLMPDNEPTPLSEDDLNEAQIRLLNTPELLARRDVYKRELNAALAEIKTRMKRTLRWLKQRRAKPQEFLELEEERRQLEEHHREVYRGRIKRLIEDAIAERDEE